MAARGMYQRETRRIDLGAGLWFGDNNIKKSDYAILADGFHGRVFSGKQYSTRWFVYEQGRRLRQGLEDGDYEISTLPTNTGRLVLTRQGSCKLG